MRLILSLLLLTAPFTLRADDTWPEVLSRMPLAATNVARLERGNTVAVMLHALRSNDVVKALVFMPGATDEFYMFHRAHAVLTNASPSLWDAVNALTNQTYIRATFLAPLLLLHTDEDPIEPLFEIEDLNMAAKMKQIHFRPHALYNDVDWDHLLPDLKRSLHVTFLPRSRSVDSWHFFRHCIACWNLTGWEMLEAVSLSGKERIRFETKRLVFEGDTRVRTRPKLDPLTR